MTITEKNITETLVRIANANLAVMDGTMEPVKKILADNDVVFAVWQDADGGIGHLIIKGDNILREVVAKQESLICNTSAIACTEAEQAHALKRIYGDKGGLH